MKQYNNEMARNRVITLRYVNAMVNAILTIRGLVVLHIFRKYTNDARFWNFQGNLQNCLTVVTEHKSIFILHVFRNNNRRAKRAGKFFNSHTKIPPDNAEILKYCSLRCIFWKFHLINIMDHMRILGTEPSSVILSQTTIMKSDAPKVPKSAKAKWDGVIIPQNYNFNKF